MCKHKLSKHKIVASNRKAQYGVFVMIGFFGNVFRELNSD